MGETTIWQYALIFVVIVLAASCRRGAVEALPSQAPTPTELIGGSTFAPIVTVTPIATSGTTAAITPTVDPCPANVTTSAAQYDIDTTIDTDNRTATVTMRVTYRNDTGQPLKQIVFNVEPNRKPNAFTLNGFEADTADVLDKYTLTGPRLEALFKTPLEPNCLVTFTMRFLVRLNAIPEGYVNGKNGYFGFSTRQINFGEWMPEVAPFINGSWITPKSWPLGEYTVSRVADFNVQVTVHGADPDKLEVVAPGEANRLSAGTWQFKLVNGRSFPLSVSSALTKISATSDDGVQIDLYYFANGQPAKAPDGTAINGPQHALDTARAAVNRYSKLFGLSPYKRLVVIEGDFPDGMEFSGMVFVGHQWFLAYDGKPDSWLTLITAHEISHQWWYALVSNDQGEAPFLDEGLALYSEVLYLEDRYPALVPWWWTFRVKNYQPAGNVDGKIYDFQNARLYINAVYLRGASMLQDIREAIGDEAFIKWLQAYAVNNTGTVAHLTDFWQAMSPDDYAKTAAIRTKYLHLPDPLHLIPATGPATAAPTATANGTRRPTASPSIPTMAATDPCCG
ncbi:MAG: hypothetical protein IT324_02500 [Anaerolineae bacterium]|nr:hypothetical protein [Anaerolineae bacterium]